MESGELRVGPECDAPRYLFIGCEILFREICWLTARVKTIVDHRWLSQGLHDLGAEKMSARLQEEIDAVPAGRYEAILLGFALCNNGVAGLAARGTRLVIPRAHDCITLLLGSRARYAEAFENRPGTYFLSSGWIERDESNLEELASPIKESLGYGMSRAELVEQYGEENAQFIMEEMGDMTRNSSRLAYIRMPFETGGALRQTAQAFAGEQGWDFVEIEGDTGLLERLLAGEWDADFLVVEPGERIRSDVGGGILACETCG